MITQHNPRQRSYPRSASAAVEPFSGPVCVVIADEDVSEDEVRHSLGDSLPLRIVSWQDQRYLAAITELRPQVIAVWGNVEELVDERCQLVASLFSRFEPTVLSVTRTDLLPGLPRLMLRQLGAGTTVQITSLSKLHLP